ncbi:MAG TPA: class I SAM-dependent methyltransferase [Terriglobia bacterium]|nr:class I SAM-dependent methyltransferase [Terriglobia bacterium]
MSFVGKTDSRAGDRTGPDFWDQWWQRTPLPPTIDPYRSGLKNYPLRSFHRYFAEVLGTNSAGQQRLIEIGCAQSVFLPYFARYLAFQVAGIDQSELGCERARRILEREGVQGEIYCADLFDPPAGVLGRFEVAISFGVVEHFDDAIKPISAIAALLKPGGKMVTLIPNLTGVLGRYQRLLDRRLYEAHVVMGRDRLAEAHRQAGLQVESAGYLMPVSLEVLNVEGWRSRALRKMVSRAHTAASRLAWMIDDYLFGLKPNRWTSPYVVSVARRPAMEGRGFRAP